MAVSSPLLRAVQTAHLIADAVGLQPTGTVPGLTERDYGSAEGLHLNGLIEPQLTAALGIGEQEQAVAHRGLAALCALAVQFPGQWIIAVAHGTLIRLTLSELTGQRYPRVLNGEVVDVPLAALFAESAV